MGEFLLIGVVLLLLASIAGAVKMWALNPPQEHLGLERRAALQELPADVLAGVVERMQGEDSGFDPDGFTAYAERVYLALQAHRLAGDFKSLEGLVSPGLIEAWKMQITCSLPFGEGAFNPNPPLARSLVFLGVDPHLDSGSVRLDFAPVAGNPERVYLTFERNRKAAPPPETVTRCPNCGAPRAAGRQCSFCGTLIPLPFQGPPLDHFAPGPDWVLVSLDPPSAWRTADQWGQP